VRIAGVPSGDYQALITRVPLPPTSTICLIGPLPLIAMG
jgi:hypothetical protein